MTDAVEKRSPDYNSHLYKTDNIITVSKCHSSSGAFQLQIKNKITYSEPQHRNTTIYWNKCRRAKKSESTWGRRFGVLLLFVSVWNREVWRNQHEYVNSRKGHRENHHNPPTPIFLDCLHTSYKYGNICGCRDTSGSPLFSSCGSASNKLTVIVSLMCLLLRNFMVVTQYKDRE